MSNSPSRLPDSNELEHIINSPAGKQLLSFLQMQNRNELNTAMEKASAGDFDTAKQIIEKIMSAYHGDLPGQLRNQHG